MTIKTPLHHLNKISLIQIEFDEHTEFEKKINLGLYTNQLKKQSSKRQIEFLAGRYAAQKSLLSLTGEILFVNVNSDRFPCWQERIIGSISHTKNKAIAVTSYKNHNQILGIDIEQCLSNDTAHEIENEILNKNEYNLIKQSEIPYKKLITLIFSVKESLFKALYPSVNQFFGFDYASVSDIDLTLGKCQVTLQKTLSTVWQKGVTFSVDISITNECIFTLICKSQ